MPSGADGGTGTCPICSQDFPLADLIAHSSRCVEEQENQEQGNCCPLCGDEYPPDVLPRHAAKCTAFSTRTVMDDGANDDTESTRNPPSDNGSVPTQTRERAELQLHCEARGIRMGPPMFDMTAHYEGDAVIDARTGLIDWPVLLLYDEYGQTDFIQVYVHNLLVKNLFFLSLH